MADYKNNPKRTMNKERAKKFASGFMGGSLKEKLLNSVGLGGRPKAKPKKKY